MEKSKYGCRLRYRCKTCKIEFYSAQSPPLCSVCSGEAESIADVKPVEDKGRKFY